MVASGDSGAFGCDSGKHYPAENGVSVGIPADSPYYTGVGGTTLSADESDPAAYWNETHTIRQPTPGSSRRWGTFPSRCGTTPWSDNGLSASSGGVSLYYQPTWPQPTPENYTGTIGRFVPDVAFAASPDHDGYMTCSAGQQLEADGQRLHERLYEQPGLL